MSDNKRVVSLAEFAAETIAITEISPVSGAYIGKQIKLDGSISDYPKKEKWWFQSVKLVPATTNHLFAYLRAARERNVCLLRGAPANLERVQTLRQNAHELKKGKDRGDHGFDDVPTRLLPLDIDGVPVRWQKNPEKAIRTVLDILGEPWASTSFVWFFSSKHGLERDEQGKWTGKIVDGKLRVRVIFITDRALGKDEATALLLIAKAKISQIDVSLARQVQPNYIRRPLWREHPDRDPLGDIDTIGRCEQTHDYLVVPADLTTGARWAKAQGFTVDIADHPDAISAVQNIGSNGSVRSHLRSAVINLLIANPCSEVTSFVDHSLAIVRQLQDMVEQHHDQIVHNLKAHKRPWSDVTHYLPDNMLDWSEWCLNHPASLHRKTIKLIKEERPKIEREPVTREAIYARVARAIARFCRGELPDPSDLARRAQNYMDMPLVELLAAPTGSRKSTLIRARAVADVMENPGKSVVILVPRHNLSNEHVQALLKEHPNGNFTAAVWRGRQNWDPDIGDGKEVLMCQRADEAKEIEEAKLSVDRHLCKQGRGKKAIKCPLFDVCGYQRQKLVEANIWFAAHELIVHKMPKAFGDVIRIYIDEFPLDAVTFGLDTNDQHVLALDRLLDPPPQHDEYDELTEPRRDLYRLLDKLKTNKDGIAPIPKKALADFGFMDNLIAEKTYSVRRYDMHRLARVEWRGKVEPKIKPTMTAKQVRAELSKADGNRDVALRAMIWQLIADNEVDICGRVQVHRTKEGRFIRIVGLKRIAKGWDKPTLISDATGDVDLLRAIWPQIMVEPEPWPQLPRPESVRFFQIVDRTLSKYSIAVEGKNKQELERKAEGARRAYAALLLKALEYGGADVGVITYKSTEEWIKENCFVPSWLKLAHHGDVTGTNNFQHVRALFEVGRNQPPPQALALQAEALFGAYVEQREYVLKKARIPIIPDKSGHTHIEVTLRQFRQVVTRALLWQSREGASIQNAGRARAGLRDTTSPLDLWRWSDLPVPELGPVEPVLWSEVDTGLDGLMLATAGVWLHCIPDAVEAFPGLVTINGLKSSRQNAGGNEAGTKNRGEGVLLIGNLISKTPSLVPFRYQRVGQGSRPARGLSLRNPEETKLWLEAKLGPLKSFAVLPPEEAPDEVAGRRAVAVQRRKARR